MTEGFDWFSEYDKESYEEDDIPSKPPAREGAIINRKGQFEKFRVMSTTAGWRSLKIAPLNDKHETMIISWDQFLKDWEERFF